MIQVLNSGDELNRSSGISAPGFIVVCVTDSSKEEEKIPLKRKKGLRELLTSKAKGLAPKDASGSQPLPTLPPPPPPPVNPFTSANLKKRKKDKEVVEEGEVIPLDEGVPPTLLKTSKAKGNGFSIKSKDAETVAEVRPPNPTWNPWLDLDSVAIPWNSSIKKFQRGSTHYVAKALE